MNIKFDIQNERLEWFKKLPLFAKWEIQNNSDIFLVMHLKWKKIQLELILTLPLSQNTPSQTDLYSIFYFKR